MIRNRQAASWVWEATGHSLPVSGGSGGGGPGGPSTNGTWAAVAFHRLLGLSGKVSCASRT